MEPLLSPRLVHALTKLRLNARTRVRSMYKGESRSVFQGGSVEFSDYREYQPGDDYRYVDWNLYARLDRLFLKVFSEEQNQGITLLLDTSASMKAGSPPKETYARRLAAALGYVALWRGDDARFGSVSTTLAWKTPWRRGRHHVRSLFESVQQVEFHGLTDFGHGLRALDRTPSGGGRITLLISDLLHPSWEEALAGLAARRESPVLLHLLSPEDWAPEESGEFDLIDAETGERLPMALDPGALETYTRSAVRWLEDVRSRCRSLGIDCYQLDTAYAIDDLFLRTLREGGLLR